jgi:hypothetical protein
VKWVRTVAAVQAFFGIGWSAAASLVAAERSWKLIHPPDVLGESLLTGREFV